MKKKLKPPPVRVGQAAEVAPGVLEQMRETHKREVEALQHSHASKLKHNETASNPSRHGARQRTMQCARCFSEVSRHAVRLVTNTCHSPTPSVWLWGFQEPVLQRLALCLMAD